MPVCPAGWGKWAVNKLGYFFFKTPEQGAATTITAAVSPDLDQHSGECTPSMQTHSLFHRSPLVLACPGLAKS